MAREYSEEAGPGWPGWAKAGVTALLLVHGAAVLSAVMAASPSSDLQRAIADRFRWYYKLVDQGYTYRFYTAGAPPTPILIADVQFGDGRTETLRIPDRAQAPRLRYQRHLALAYHLFEDVRRAPRDPGGDSRSRWAASYARHLCAENPGASRVVLYLQDHLNPSPRELVEAAQEGRAIDAEGPRYYGDRQRIGAYSCDD
ncbi:hypothetical protein [Tautonia plasticadhaerens]|uniref:Uncharacterized protein n=1 Tax=Tautonia plasticadhaerens TaxID=2527974 RepID=A0A518GW35_9BACT|nr:hypothetical protein [Tautonia plasticadhaerens]QDV32807.1 hypothetical protein ElP_06470 [Tautonia plasticadhaerens]